MPLYSYTALNGAKRSRGTLEALSLQEAKRTLREQGLLVTRLQSRRSRSRRLQGEALVNFTLQLGQLIRSGMPVFESLTALEEQSRGSSTHPVLARLCEQIKGGARLSEALAAQPENFDPLYSSLVAAGEASGTLDQALEKLGTLLARRSRIAKSLTTALIYPAVIASFCLVVVTLLLTFAIPSLADLFEGRELPLFTRSILGLSHLLTDRWHLLLPLTALKAIVSWLLLRTPQGRRLRRRALMRIGPVRRVVVQSALARFSRTFATLLTGGLSTLEALQMARATMLSPELEMAMARAEAGVVAGGRLSEQLRREPLVPPLFARMLAVGEEGGEMGPMLERMATLYEEELERMLTRLSALAQPIILVGMGALVGLIMLAVLLPLTDIQF